MMLTTGTPQFKAFYLGTVKIYIDYCEKMGYKPDEMSFTEGRKYIKVIQNHSVHAFVDKDTGDVLLPASWSRPDKHARGNIFDEWNGLKNMGPHGPAYLR